MLSLRNNDQQAKMAVNFKDDELNLISIFRMIKNDVDKIINR